jgi:hypothetical protein
MKSLKKTQYILFLLLSILIFTINNSFSDETGIFIGAVSKHYCTCIFVSKLNPDHCSDSLNNFMEQVLEDPNLASAANSMKVDIDADAFEVSVSLGDRAVQSIFNGKKGCYLDKIN